MTTKHTAADNNLKEYRRLLTWDLLQSFDRGAFAKWLYEEARSTEFHPALQMWDQKRAMNQRLAPERMFR